MTSAGWTTDGRPLLAGEAAGGALVLDAPLSFWGGVDPATGVIVDRHHALAGASVAGVVLVLPAGRGSSSSSSVLAECLVAGFGPIAIVLGEADPILLVGALVAAELGGPRCPMVVVGDARLRIGTGDRVGVRAGGVVEVQPRGT